MSIVHGMLAVSVSQYLLKRLSKMSFNSDYPDHSNSATALILLSLLGIISHSSSPVTFYPWRRVSFKETNSCMLACIWIVWRSVMATLSSFLFYSCSDSVIFYFTGTLNLILKVCTSVVCTLSAFSGFSFHISLLSLVLHAFCYLPRLFSSFSLIHHSKSAFQSVFWAVHFPVLRNHLQWGVFLVVFESLA